jgi:hypothetical protein
MGSSKKESWNIGKGGKGTKTTVYENNKGEKRIVVQKAERGFWGGRSAHGIISEERRRP